MQNTASLQFYARVLTATAATGASFEESYSLLGTYSEACEASHLETSSALQFSEVTPDGYWVGSFSQTWETGEQTSGVFRAQECPIDEENGERPFAISFTVPHCVPKCQVLDCGE